MRIVNLCGRTTLSESAALIQQASIVVSAESALFHIATAMKKPAILPAGGGHFGRFFTYDRTQTVIDKKMPCYDCNWKCRYAIPYCIHDIRVESVVSALKKKGLHPTHSVKNRTAVYQYFQLGSFYKRIGDYKRAQYWFDAVIRSNVYDALTGAAHFHIAEMFIYGKKIQSARRHLIQCTTRMPHHKKAYTYLQEINR